MQCDIIFLSLSPVGLRQKPVEMVMIFERNSEQSLMPECENAYGLSGRRNGKGLSTLLRRDRVDE